ncbi:Carboxy-terminal-processing protease [Candidatus Magnetomoraceae bacterium gMMP-15]
MTLNNRYIKLGIVITAAIIFFMAGSGQDLTAENNETYKGLKLFSDVIDLVEKNYVDEVDTEKLIHSAIQGMVRSLDPHSAFMPPEAFEELQIDTHGEFGGIGIVITMKDDVLTVISPIEGTPAYRAGIKAGDKIIKVDGEPTRDLEMWEAVRKMRGPKGTSVIITIVRDNIKKPIDFSIVRDIIPIESVRSSVLEDGYGYLWVTNFRDKTTTDIELALQNMEAEQSPLKGLILDLRDNPGGLLDQAIKVTDLFIDEGDIVSIKGRSSTNTRVFSAGSNGIERNYPLVILINGGSASASEIVAGALQDHKRALILGTTSFGKGSVQTVEPLRDGYGLKFTIARYYTPNGRSIQAQGIIPDIIVKARFMEDESMDQGILLKEKDLKNHLEAEPDKKTDERDNKAEKKEEIEKKQLEKMRKRSEMKHGKMKVEELLEDYQIHSALDMLKSFEILKSSFDER